MKKGFTLSEVLITLAIVGVIAALTIPAIVKNYRNKLYVSQLKRTYVQLTDAMQAIMNDESTNNYYSTSAGVAPDDIATCKKGPCYFLTNYFKTIKTACGGGAEGSCTAAHYKTLDGAVDKGAMNGSYCVQISTGATICISHNTANTVSSVIIDVNGQSEPNIAGRDVFSLDIKQNGTLADYGSGSIDESVQGCSADLCGTQNNGTLFEAACGCMTKILEDGWTMTY